MRIGSFAKLCKTQISVLRHYDKIGLIKPDYIDKFTDYRYYAPEQVKDFELISKFKKLGFSLKDVKKIMTLWDSHSEATEKIFNDRIKELELLISQIKHEKNNLLKLNRGNINMNGNNNLNVNIDDIKFEDDPEAVGKWIILGEYDTKESFLSQSRPAENNYGEMSKEIYFLPGGQRYWLYGWTKGAVIFKNGDYAAVNPYKIEEINGEKFMFVEWASYYYVKYGGEKTVLVLKQADNKKYMRAEISKMDDINMPFVEDKKILGKWKAVAFIENKEEYFNPGYSERRLFFKSAEFKEKGRCEHIYGEENRKAVSPVVKWTKGYVLIDGGEKLAEKYEIKTIDGVEYLFIEWKSGDYVWGGREPNYYVFVRE